MIYISDFDNKIFNTKEECLEHENIIRGQRERNNRLHEIYDKNKEIEKLTAELGDLVRKFIKDYGYFDCSYLPWGLNKDNFYEKFV